jgi:hypothetical protein
MDNGPLIIDNYAAPHRYGRKQHYQLSIINCQFPTAYAPNTEYISAITNAEQFCIDIEEPYIRQTFRNHCEILTSQGIQKLSIPIEKKSCFDTLNNRPNMIKDVKIDYSENWQRQHWRSIQTSYSNSPYFLYYQDELWIFYEKRYRFLVDFNSEILMFVLKKIGTGCEVVSTPLNDRCSAAERSSVAERCSVASTPLSHSDILHPPYQQVFGENFVPNLSSFDLLFNCGPESKNYLCKV